MAVMNITVTEEVKRAAVLSGLSAGRIPKEIAKFHKVALSFV